VIVASGDRIIAIDGSTGGERWHYRRAGARIVTLTASPDGEIVLAEFGGSLGIFGSGLGRHHPTANA
jgi:hypothetical protein